jgi:tetratricopeptide (TPR) repeat protein
MAPRANWKGYLRLSLGSCPIALYPASSLSEKVSFNRINRKTGHRLKQQNVDSETGDVASVDCLRKALTVAPDYADAMFNLALLLQRKGAYAEAADHWRRYLAVDRASEWAARARRSLKFCEIQVNSQTNRPADSDQAA